MQGGNPPIKVLNYKMVPILGLLHTSDTLDFFVSFFQVNLRQFYHRFQSYEVFGPFLIAF